MNRNATATILIVLAIGIYFTVTRSILNDTKSIQTVNTQYAGAIANAEQLIKVREEVLHAYNTISADNKERLEKMVPDTVDNIRLIIDLNNVAGRHGLLLKGVTAVAANDSTSKQPAAAPNIPSGRILTPANTGNIPTPTLDSVTINFSVDAPYLEFISFLQDLEANLRIMELSHLGLTTDDTGKYSFTVELKTYWLRQQ